MTKEINWKCGKKQKAGNDNTQKVCDNLPMGGILSALLTT